MDQPKRKIVMGVIGSDVHAVGNRILAYALEQAGFEVINLGVMVSQEEFIAAAIETAADAILVSSLYGHGELDCRGLRARCRRSGADGISLWIGGNLVVGKQASPTWRALQGDGVRRVYPPGTSPETAVKALREILSMEAAVDAYPHDPD